MKKNIAYAAFISAAMLICLLPIVLMLVGVKNENRENRPLSPEPEFFTEGGLNLDYPSEFDSFLNDHFALKEHYVTALNSVSIAVFGEAFSKEAIYGKNDMLFFDETLDDYQGIDLLSDEELRLVAEQLYKLETELIKKGSRMVFLIAPNKNTIYPEYMPGRFKKASERSNMERLYEYLGEYGVTTVDAKATLYDNKGDELLYYHHDSHWNNYGAALIYNEIAAISGLPTFDTSDAEAAIARDFTGDLHNFIWPSVPYFEERIAYEFMATYESDRPIDFERNNYAATSCDVNDLKLLVYHDSFGRSLQPFFSHNVGRVVFSSAFPYDMSYVDELKPDIVVIEMVERNIDHLLDLVDRYR